MGMQTGDGDSNTGSVSGGTNYNPKYSVQPNQEKRRLSQHHLIPSHPNSSPVRDFFTVLALSFHAVFEGLAVGLEKDTEDVWAMFAAIATHKFVITFCVSLELLQGGASALMFSLYLVTFSLISPLGIGIGIGIVEMAQPGSEVHEVTVGVLQGMAGGTIMYVVMFEVLQREKSRDVPGLLQLLGILVGFVVMLIIELFGAHEHDHGFERGQRLLLQGNTLNASHLLEEDVASPLGPLSSLLSSTLSSIPES